MLVSGCKRTKLENHLSIPPDHRKKGIFHGHLGTAGGQNVKLEP